MNVLMELSRIVINDHGPEQVIYLREKGGERSFPIRIGIAEAYAIDRRLKRIPVPRPMTHDLLAIVIEALGGKLEKIVVNDLRRLDPTEMDQTFIATLHIRRGQELVTIDARPSDSIALGVGLGTPIYVAEEVLDAATKGPSIEEQVEILRARRKMLKRAINDLTAQLANEDFKAKTAPGNLSKLHRRLDEMTAEHEAIGQLLDKLT